MARLTEEEANLLKRLKAKSEAPDEPSIGRAINVSIDLGDEKQVKWAQKLGLLGSLDDESESTDDRPEETDETPKRRGYFND